MTTLETGDAGQILEKTESSGENIVDELETIDTTLESGQDKQTISYDDLFAIMGGILVELKKLNLHMSLITDVTIKNAEIID